MRFNSYEFIFVFLPGVWLIWRSLLRWVSFRSGCAWLALASLGFYAWWDWRYAPLLVFSLLLNFTVGRQLIAAPPKGTARKAWLIMGLLWNLGLLGYFKYRDFFAMNVDVLFGAHFPLLKLALPLGISFFTFQKIAFLVDAYEGKVAEIRFGEFALFVLFFPQLIAGPIVHHGDFIPQLHAPPKSGLAARRQLALGLSVFALGLFQKCMVADTLAPVAESTFGLSAQGVDLRLQEAWIGLLSYSLQLLFDFSGYSHMAIGLALLFGLRLPVNFLAPYRSRSVIEFWRRWHMTLAAFLRDYVYIPLGGNRVSQPLQLFNLIATMLIGGFWHGAGWTFVLWGLWHGVALCVNHLWVSRRGKSTESAPLSSWWAQPLTILTVMLGWVLFRAQDLVTVRQLTESLIGLHGISVPVSWHEWVRPLEPIVRPRGLFPNVNVTGDAIVALVFATLSVAYGPRLLAWFGVTGDDVTPLPSRLRSELAPADTALHWTRAVTAGAMAALAIAALGRTAPFLYFQF